MRPVTFPLICLLAAGWISCGQSPPPKRELSIARVLPSGMMQGIDIDVSRELQEKGEEPDSDTLQVLVEGEIFQVESGFFNGLGGFGEGSLKRLFGEMLLDLLGKDAVLGKNKSMSFQAFASGQLSQSMTVNQTSFIRDYTFLNGEPELKPLKGILNTGASVKIRASLVGEEVEIQEFLPEFLEPLGERQCRAVISRAGRSWDINWQEPVLLVAALDPEFSIPFRLREGEVLAISLPYRIRQAAASVRALAEKDSIRETYRDQARLNEGHTSPLNLECIVFLSFRRLPPEKRAKESTHE